MARTQFTFTFTNAQPGSVVSFDNIDADHLFAAATGGARLGHPLVLNAQNAISVWSDAAQLTATTEDGAGNNISATATVANPSVTTADGTAGQNPFSSGTSLPDQTGQSGKVLGTDGTNPEWVSGGSSAPADSWMWVGLPGDVALTDAGNDNTRILTWDPTSLNVQNGPDFQIHPDNQTIEFLTHGLYQLWLCPQIDRSADADGIVGFFPSIQLANSGVGVWPYELVNIDVRPMTDPRVVGSGGIFATTTASPIGGQIPWTPTIADPGDTVKFYYAGSMNAGTATLTASRSSLAIVRIA